MGDPERSYSGRALSGQTSVAFQAALPGCQSRANSLGIEPPLDGWPATGCTAMYLGSRLRRSAGRSRVEDGAGPEGPTPPVDAAVCQTVTVSDTEVRTELPLKVTVNRVPFEMPFSFTANVPFLLSLTLVRFFP